MSLWEPQSIYRLSGLLQVTPCSAGREGWDHFGLREEMQLSGPGGRRLGAVPAWNPG